MGLNSVWIALIVLGAIYLGWRDSMRARERAISVCRALCARHDVQFLDETVALARIGVRRDGSRGFKLRRVYEFEFSAEGRSRTHGSIALTGDRVEFVTLPGVTSYLEH